VEIVLTDFILQWIYVRVNNVLIYQPVLPTVDQHDVSVKMATLVNQETVVQHNASWSLVDSILFVCQLPTVELLVFVRRDFDWCRIPMEVRQLA
jgi:hypothetical protein